VLDLVFESLFNRDVLQEGLEAEDDQPGASTTSESKSASSPARDEEEQPGLDANAAEEQSTEAAEEAEPVVHRSVLETIAEIKEAGRSGNRVCLVVYRRFPPFVSLGFRVLFVVLIACFLRSLVTNWKYARSRAAGSSAPAEILLLWDVALESCEQSQGRSKSRAAIMVSTRFYLEPDCCVRDFNHQAVSKNARRKC